MRWGLRKCEMIQSRLRTLQQSIAFVRESYESSDPNYAQGVINHYQREMETLRREQMASQCEG